MNITKRTIWKLDLCVGGYWMQRACADIAQDLGIDPVELDDVPFTTPEAAAEVGRRVMQKYVEHTPYCSSIGFANREDDDKALGEVGLSIPRCLISSTGAGRHEGRWAGPPQITWDPAKGSIVMERAIEVRWTVSRNVLQKMQVEGETWTRQVVETQESGWYRGIPETMSIQVERVEIVEIG